DAANGGGREARAPPRSAPRAEGPEHRRPHPVRPRAPLVVAGFPSGGSDRAPTGMVDDKVALARAHLELAVAHEMNGDEVRSLYHAEAALGVDKAFAAAHGMLRRKRHERGAIGQMLAHLEYELES